MVKLSRRALLQASGVALGTSLVAPFLRRAWAAPPSVTRLVLVVEGNGIYPRSFASDKAKQAITAAGAPAITNELMLHRLYKHNQPLLVTGDPLTTPVGSLAPLAGPGASLVPKSAVVLGLSSTVAGGGHSSFQGGLACARGDSDKTAAVTIDAAIAAKIGTLTPFDAVRLGVNRGTTPLAYNTCAFGPGRPAPITTSPANAYASLFGAIAAGASQAEIDERKKLLDFAKADVNAALATFGGSSVERAKLETYLAAIETAQTRQQRLIALRNKVQPLVPGAPSADPRYASADPLERLAVQFDLATASLLGGLTNVVVLVSGPGGGLDLVYSSVLARHFTGTEASIDRHTLQHGVADPKYQTAIMDVTAEHVKLIAKMARTLDSQPEGDGTMLDHTLILYMSDNGEQHHSEAKEWPMLLVGGKKLGFKTDGRTVVYPGWGNANNRQVSNMFNTLGHATGDTAMNEFGDEGSTRLAKGPLGSEIWAPP